MKIRLVEHGRNMAEPELGLASVFFSYESAIAVRFRADRIAAFNPDMRGRSTTTSKHATQMGVRHLPDAPSANAFVETVAAAIAAAVAFEKESAR